MVFGRRIKDLMPIKPAQVKGMARRHMARSLKLNKQTRELAPLKVGHTISIQNQHSNSPIKWDHPGMIVEVGYFDKHTIKVDGSGRLTNRNRRFLQPIRRQLAGRHQRPDKQPWPRGSERVAKKNRATTDRRASGQWAPSSVKLWRVAVKLR